MSAQQVVRRGWGQLADGRWITADDLADQTSERTEWRLNVPRGYPLSVLLGPDDCNIRAIEQYTGSQILRMSGPGGGKEYFIIMGINASVTLASVMISDFFLGEIPWVTENLAILRKIIKGEITAPSAYAQGCGVMRFYPEPSTGGNKHQSTSAMSSPDKDRRAWARLASNEEFEEHYTLSTVAREHEDVEIDLRSLEADVEALVVTSGEDDSEEDAVSVGPLDSSTSGDEHTV